jgi:hypothetical protein
LSSSLVVVPLGVIQNFILSFSIHVPLYFCNYTRIYHLHEVGQEYADKNVVRMWCIL